MKKIAEKVALVALICIAFVFALTAVLYVTDTINNYYNIHEFYDQEGLLLEMPNNTIQVILLIVLGVVLVLLSLYLLYVNFSEKENLRNILLSCDADSATRSGIKVIDNIVKGCSNQVEGISVRKIHVRTDEKGGLIAYIYVRVNADEVSEKINVLRCLLVDSFKNTLNLKFNTINFRIDKLNGKYVPSVEQAEKLAGTLDKSQETMKESYHEPMKAENQKQQEKQPQKEQKGDKTPPKTEDTGEQKAEKQADEKAEEKEPALAE